MDISQLSSASSQLVANPMLLLSQKNSSSTKRRVSCIATNKLGSGTAVDEKESICSNLYKVLRLNPNNATVDEVKRAYRSMALRHHPDVCHPSRKAEATRIFLRLHHAYKTLSDPVLRTNYDSELLGGNHEYESTRRTKPWQDQILALKRRSSHRMTQKHGSWATRVRAQNAENYKY